MSALAFALVLTSGIGLGIALLRRGRGHDRPGASPTEAAPRRVHHDRTQPAPIGERSTVATQLTLVDALHEPVYSTSLDQRLLTWNAAAERIYGFAAEEVLGRRVHEVLRTELPSGEPPDALHAEVQRSGDARRELHQRRRDGTEIVAEAHVVAVRDRDGAVAGHVFVTRDVSEQKRAESALRQSEAKFRAAFHGAGLAMAILDDRGQLLEHNRAFREMLGYTEQELAGRSIASLLHPDDGPRARRDFQEALAGETDLVVGERRYLRKDGSVAQGILRSTIIRDDAGKFLYSVGLIEDVTQKRAVEAQLVFADRMASMGTLAAGVAHEINNPLSFILANLNYVADELSRLEHAPEDVLRAVDDTREGAVRVREIVRDLKTFSRADDRGVEDAIDVRQVLQSAVNLTQNEIRHRARLSLDVGDVPRVRGSAHRLAQVFVNLLINAAHAITDPVPDRNEIRVRCATGADGRAVIEVTDTGRGIAPENLARIFEPFFTTKPVGIGTGLGLSICHGIVTRLGGAIEVESQLGAGSTFRVSLPPASADRGDEQCSRADATVESSRARVLVVDDEPMVASAVARILMPEHVVTTASGARAALDLVRRGDRLDVLVCDLMMPEMTGMDLHAELGRTAPELRDRMIFLTGGAFTPAAEKFLLDVPNPRIEKPFEAATLRALVQRMVADRR